MNKLHSRIASISFLFLFAGTTALAQSGFGMGFGTENLHIGYGKLRSWVPHIAYEYLTSGMQVAWYIDATALKRTYSNSSSTIDGQGNIVPYQEDYQYWHIVLQTGFKEFLNGDADEKKPLFFVGGGFVDCISLNRYSAKGTDPNYPISIDAKGTSNSFGLGFLAGMQYYLKPVVLELNCNLDFLFKQVVEYGGETNIHTDSRIMILIPLKPFK